MPPYYTTTTHGSLIHSEEKATEYKNEKKKKELLLESWYGQKRGMTYDAVEITVPIEVMAARSGVIPDFDAIPRVLEEADVSRARRIT